MADRLVPAVQYVPVAPEYAGQRIDNFLLRLLKGAPKSLIYRLVRTGQVRVNGRRIRPDHRLQGGDQVRIPPVRLGEPSPPARPPAALRQQLEAAILLEDNHLLILDKPSGLAVHGGSGVSFAAIETLRAMRPSCDFLELAHRLDRDTSGCLIMAKKASILREIHAALAEGRFEKQYLALVRGPWLHGTRTVDAPLQKYVLRSGERKVEVMDDGKPSCSRFRLIHPLRIASLMEVTLVTGRTHQIRVHAAHVGHPVAGDERYGDEGFNLLMKTHGLQRLFLHAHRVSFTLAGRDITLSAPLPESLKRVLDRLEA